MINSINQQPYNYPRTSVGAVNIQIFNPTAYACAPNSYSTSCPMPQYYSGQIQNPQMNSLYGSNTTGSNANYPQNYNNNLNLDKKADKKEVDFKDKEKVEDKNEKHITPLTDEYIKTLENYLNDKDPKVRLMGAKELLERFKEDSSRLQDPALTALLNKSLQDPSATVRFVALTTLDVGYAKGDNKTVEILNQIKQNSPDEYGEDSLLAAQILLNMNTPKENVK